MFLTKNVFKVWIRLFVDVVICKKYNDLAIVLFPSQERKIRLCKHI